MSAVSSRGVVPAPPTGDDNLRLPRPPGIVRRFWARHPLLTDALVMLFATLASFAGVGGVPRAVPTTGDPGPNGEVTVAPGLPANAVILWSIVLLLSGLALLWRRRAPLSVFVVATLSSMLLLAVTGAGGAPVAAVALYSVAVYRSARSCWIAFGASALALLTIDVTRGVLATAPFTGVSVAHIGLLLIGTLLGINVGNRRRYLEALIDRSRQLLVERDQHGRLAAAAERARIARELHDIVAHSLTVVVALSEGAIATKDGRRARSAMDAVSSTARGALTEMRAMLGVLRDGDAENPPILPVESESAHEVVTTAQHAGFPATLTVTGTPDAAAPVRLAVSRIVQESVTNAMRHAPNASFVDVVITHAPGSVRVEVVNDGAPPGDAGAGGFGLRGLRERVAHVRGSILVGPDGPGRWAVRATLPSAGAPDAPAPASAEGEA